MNRAGEGRSTVSPRAAVSTGAGVSSSRANQLRLSVADRITPIWCQVSGRAWQKACTAPAVLGENLALDTKRTPDVPSDKKEALGRTAPMPQAEAALSPPPPATTGA